MGDLVKQLMIGDFIDVVYEVSINEWNGNRELQAQIIDIKTAETSDLP